jgi:FAD:protein FMN transferase
MTQCHQAGSVDEISVNLSTWKTQLWLAARLPDSAAAWLRDVLNTEVSALDTLASRFRHDSQLSAVNRDAGTWVQVSWEFVAVLTASLEAAAATDGLVNPLLGTHVVAAGYDEWADQDSGITAPATTSDWQAIEIKPGRPAAQVRIPAGSALDLGAVAKGWLADRLAQIVHDSTGADCVANMGGDLRVISPGEPWVVAADAGPEETHMELENAGLATSGIGHRSWKGGHHIIDPRTGRPAETPWDSVSVLAGTAAGANTASTACMVLGDQAPRWLADKGLDGWFVGPGGERMVGRWQQLRHPETARA